MAWLKFLIESFTPGAITPPSYLPFLITSNVVAVPKSKTRQFLNFFAPIAVSYTHLRAHET